MQESCRAVRLLLAKAATWIGSIANQSRATIGGNLVNGSPAADSSPALLVYDAEVELISVRGQAADRVQQLSYRIQAQCDGADELMLCDARAVCGSRSTSST
jgi:CO/xanthine dehydrogenase FAD-binding subunit